MSAAIKPRRIPEKKIQVYLKTRPGFLVLATSPISTAVIWGFRPSAHLSRKEEAAT